tara:strand:- start:32854 stop:34092 length:1239 start_codon:yes stop_codon:yes gene_type:complete
MQAVKLMSVLLSFFSISLLTFNASVNAASLTWQADLPPLPAAMGEEIQHGVAGAFSGVLTKTTAQGSMSEVLIIAGGANFSKTPLIDGIKADSAPQKIYHQAIFLLSKDANNQARWQQANISLPKGAAYGESFSTEQGIFLLGGEVTQTDGTVQHSSDMALIAYQQGKLTYRKIGTMPFTFAKGGGAYHQGKIYLVGGMQDGETANHVYSYDIKTTTWQKETSYPGTSRVSPLASIHFEPITQTSRLFIFSGFSTQNQKNIALDDALSFNITNKSEPWQHMGSIKILQDNQQSLIGAAAIQVGPQQTLFLGGYNKKTWDDWLAQYQSVKGTAQEKGTKIAFFSQPPQSFNWNKAALLFDSSDQTWTNLGDSPFLPNCGAAIASWQNSIVLLNGEIKPGVRTASVKTAYFNAK